MGGGWGRVREVRGGGVGGRHPTVAIARFEQNVSSCG